VNVRWRKERDATHFTHSWNSNAVQTIARLERIDNARYTMWGELI